jgi:hypothetical protein
VGRSRAFVRHCGDDDRDTPSREPRESVSQAGCPIERVEGLSAIGKPRNGLWCEFSTESHYEVVITDISGTGHYSLPIQVEPFSTAMNEFQTCPQQLD